MTIIFSAKTSDGHILKILAELLQNNIKTACFEIDEKGIFLKMTDINKTILIDIELPADSFSLYTFNNPAGSGSSSERLIIGISVINLYKILKNVKKSDFVKLYIDDKSPDNLGIKNKQKGVQTCNFIKIQKIQNLHIESPTGYDKFVFLTCAEFQKTCKGFSQIPSKTTRVIGKGRSLQFVSDADITSRCTEFKDIDSDYEEDDEESEYDEKFNIEQLVKITKITGLSKNMKIYYKKDSPLLFRTSVGELGKISVYIKSIDLQELDSKVADSDEE
jgi:proliferating cell nuclear antigen PCNA